MTLPVWDKTWSVTHWSAIASGNGDEYDDHTLHLEFKNLLLATGFWTVAGSSDNTTFGMDGVDRWTDASVMSDNKAWIVLECATIGSSGQFQMLLNHTDNYTYGVMEVSFSQGGLYVTDGTTTTNVPPVASDDRYYSIRFVGEWDDGGGDRRCDLWYASDGTAFRSMSHGDNGVGNGYLWAFEESGEIRTEWTDNFFFFYESPTVSSWTGGYADPWVTVDGLDTTIRMTAEGNSLGWIVEHDAFQYENDGEWWMQKALYWFCNNARKYGIWGRPIDWWFAPPTGVATKTLFPSTGSTTHITYENVVLPWDNTTPWGPAI